MADMYNVNSSDYSLGDYSFGTDEDTGYEDSDFIDFEDDSWDSNWEYDFSSDDYWTDSFTEPSYGDEPSGLLDYEEDAGYNLPYGAEEEAYYDVGDYRTIEDDKDSKWMDLLLGKTDKDKVDTVLGSLGDVVKTGFSLWQQQQSQERQDERDKEQFERDKEMAKLKASLKGGGGGGKPDPITVRAEGEGEEQKGKFTKRIA